MAEHYFHMGKKIAIGDHRVTPAGWELRAPQSNLLLTVGPALSSDQVALGFVQFIHFLSVDFFSFKVKERQDMRRSCTDSD